MAGCNSCGQAQCCCQQWRGEPGKQGLPGPRGLSGPTNWWFSQAAFISTLDSIKRVSLSMDSVVRILWPGTTATGGVKPTEAKANVWLSSAGTGTIEIYDLTNSTVVATTATGAVTSTSASNIETLTITAANVTATPAVWQVRMQAASGGFAHEINLGVVEIRSYKA